MSLLQVDDVSKRFGGLVAIDRVSFEVETGEIVSVIGPNGAGKSTLFKVITSFLKPTAGQVLFEGEPITGLQPHIVARRGVVRTFQESTIFKEMTALENVVVAHHLRLERERGGDVEQLLLTLRQRRCHRIEPRPQAENVRDLLDSLIDLAIGGEPRQQPPAFPLTRHQRGRDGLAHGQPWKDRDQLERAREAAVGQGHRSEPGDVLTHEQHLAAGRPQQSGQEVDQRGFAGAVRADHRDDLAGVDP